MILFTFMTNTSEQSKDFFSFPKQLKSSAAALRSESGLCRGYRGLQAHTGDQTTTAYEYVSANKFN